MWEELSKQVRGYHEKGKHTLYGRITTNAGPWEIILDTYSRRMGDSYSNTKSYTRMRAPFINHDSLTCEIYNSTFSSEIAKAMGMQDIVVGDDYFDDKFIIKSKLENCYQMKSCVH